MCTSLPIYLEDIIPLITLLFIKTPQFFEEEGRARSKIILIQYVYISLVRNHIPLYTG